MIIIDKRKIQPSFKKGRFDAESKVGFRCLDIQIFSKISNLLDG